MAEFGHDRSSGVSTVALSPGDRRIAISISSPRGAPEVWIKDLEGGRTLLRLGGASSWSHDGSRLLVAADTSGRVNYDVWSVASDGISTPELLAAFQPSATVLRVDSDGQVHSLLASDSISIHYACAQPGWSLPRPTPE